MICYRTENHRRTILWRGRVLDGLTSNTSSVLALVVDEELVCFGLSGTVWVGVIEQVLDSNQDLFDGDCWAPSFLLVQNRQANGTGRVHVGMEQRRDKFAWKTKQNVRILEIKVKRKSRYIEEQLGIHFDLHLGGLLGYSSLNSIETLNTPPSQSVPSFPGIPASHFMILEDPSCFGW